MKRSVNVVRGLGAIALAGLWTLPLACGSKDKPAANANAGFSTGTTDPDAGATDAAPPPSGAWGTPPPDADAGAPPPPLGTVTTTDPNQLAALAAAAAAAAQALLQPPQAGGTVESGIQAGAAKHAPGMTAEGQIAKGQLAENGQHLAFLVNMQAGRCYTIVGHGIGVSDLHINVFAPPFYNVLSAQDATTGPTAVVGAGKNALCPIVPLAVPYKIDAYAKKGAGEVGIQVFSKAK